MIDILQIPAISKWRIMSLPAGSLSLSYPYPFVPNIKAGRRGSRIGLAWNLTRNGATQHPTAS